MRMGLESRYHAHCTQAYSLCWIDLPRQRDRGNSQQTLAGQHDCFPPARFHHHFHLDLGRSSRKPGSSGGKTRRPLGWGFLVRVTESSDVSSFPVAASKRAFILAEPRRLLCRHDDSLSTHDTCPEAFWNGTVIRERPAFLPVDAASKPAYGTSATLQNSRRRSKSRRRWDW